MIKYFLQNEEWSLERKTPGASCYDLRAYISEPRMLIPGHWFVFRTGLHLEMPIGIEAQVRSRSGLAATHGVAVLITGATVDSDYRGEVFVTLINHGHIPYTIEPGDRIAQLAFAPVLCTHRDMMVAQILMPPPMRVSSTSELSSTDRGSGGFGSTGR